MPVYVIAYTVKALNICLYQGTLFQEEEYHSKKKKL
ncbi:hypothetical protein A3Q56_08613 [Intoshia linei]|uniref:Uncharacterized protein n=1 Tax=Intoshia linei TaxID=1819745 RepID=A0A177AQ82_9BILA|nr:hypothetical protein A3Q56_08613 [Intoshia linei]